MPGPIGARPPVVPAQQPRPAAAPPKPVPAAPRDTFEYPKGSPELVLAQQSVNAWLKDLDPRNPPVSMEQLPQALKKFQEANGLSPATGKLDLKTRERMWVLDRQEYRDLAPADRARVREHLTAGKNGDHVLRALQEQGVNRADVLRLAANENFAKAHPDAIREAYSQLAEYARDRVGVAAVENLRGLATSEGFSKLNEGDQLKLLSLQGALPDATTPLAPAADRFAEQTKMSFAMREETMHELLKYAKNPTARFDLSIIASSRTYDAMPPDLQRFTLDALGRHASEPEKTRALLMTFIGSAIDQVGPAEQRRMISQAVGER